MLVHLLYIPYKHTITIASNLYVLFVRIIIIIISKRSLKGVIYMTFILITFIVHIIIAHTLNHKGTEISSKEHVVSWNVCYGAYI